MASALRTTGISLVGEVPWAHSSASSRKERLEGLRRTTVSTRRSSIARSWVSRWPCCTTSGAAELLDVARNHQFAIATRQGSWQVIETTQLKRAARSHGGDERLALWHSWNPKRPAVASVQEI